MALVLTRKVGETIMIGPDITITVVEARAGRTRIGIAAPKEVLVLRGELVNERVDGDEACVAWGCTEPATCGDYCEKHREKS